MPFFVTRSKRKTVAAYRAVFFADIDGKLAPMAESVMSDLSQFCGAYTEEGTANATVLARMAGRAEVFAHIVNLLSISEEAIKQFDLNRVMNPDDL